MNDPNQIIKYYDHLRKDFIEQYNLLSKDKKLDHDILKDLSENAAISWAKNHFMYLICIDDQKIIELL